MYVKYYLKGDLMQNVRPESFQRITTEALAIPFIEEQIKSIKETVGDKKVLLALSGGVDSSVVAALLIKAIGKQLVCVHVNHGLMRKDESEAVLEIFGKNMDANLIYVDATDRFLDKLAGVADPERKRKIIGKEFIEVFAEEARKLDGIDFLAQGTIYPDILESKSGVKSHHNDGGLPEDLNFELVEPVKLLYKDEVRVVGEALGLPHAPALAFVASVLSRVTALQHCARLMQFCARNLTSAALPKKYGSTLSQCPTLRALA